MSDITKRKLITIILNLYSRFVSYRKYFLQLHTTNMSTSIEEIKVFRYYFIGQYDQLVLNVKANNTYGCYSCSISSGLSEKEAVSIIANDFAKDYKSEYYKEKIVQGFHQLRLRPVTDTFSDYMDIPVLKDQLEPHSSCKITNNELHHITNNNSIRDNLRPVRP